MKERMKHALALVLAVMMLAASGAAEDTSLWRDGRSPSKPYEGVPEVDLTQQLGYMMFYPNATMPASRQCRKLYVYLPRRDVTAGEGKLYVCTEEEGMVWSTAMNDEAHVIEREMGIRELEGFLWGDGMCFEVTLPKSLDLGKHYFVNIEKGAITTPYEGVVNPVIGGTEAWAFTVEGEYGVSGMEYRRAQEDGSYEEGITEPAAGDEIHFELTLGGEAAMAVAYGYYDTVDFVPNMFTESGEITGQVTGEYPTWGIMFLDAEGNELDHVDF